MIKKYKTQFTVRTVAVWGSRKHKLETPLELSVIEGQKQTFVCCVFGFRHKLAFSKRWKNAYLTGLLNKT